MKKQPAVNSAGIPIYKNYIIYKEEKGARYEH